jgi:glycerophosphoryl diester phosphodiesterase
MWAGAAGHTQLMATLPPLYAHRLGREPGPDSSRAALQATLAGPVGGLETDACLTADGQLVLLHDPWLSGATTLSGWVHQTLWSEVRRARLRDRDGAPTRETPMLLEELLDGAPRELPVQVEVKSYGDPALARASAAAVCRVRARARRRAPGRPPPRSAGSREDEGTATVSRCSRSIPPHAKRPRANGWRRG